MESDFWDDDGGSTGAVYEADTPIEPTVTNLDTSGDGIADTFAIDSNGNGIADEFVFDANQDGVVDGAAFDTNEDGLIDRLAIDANQDGIPESGGTDTDLDGFYDRTHIDANENGTSDETENTQVVTIGGPETVPGYPGPFPDTTSLSEVWVSPDAPDTTSLSEIWVLPSDSDYDGDGRPDRADADPWVNQIDDTDRDGRPDGYDYNHLDETE